MPPSRREELVDAAMRVFYRQGFHGDGIGQGAAGGGDQPDDLVQPFQEQG